MGSGTSAAGDPVEGVLCRCVIQGGVMNPVEVNVVVALGAFVAMLLGCGAMALRQWWGERQREDAGEGG